MPQRDLSALRIQEPLFLELIEKPSSAQISGDPGPGRAPSGQGRPLLAKESSPRRRW